MVWQRTEPGSLFPFAQCLCYANCLMSDEYQSTHPDVGIFFLNIKLFLWQAYVQMESVIMWKTTTFKTQNSHSPYTLNTHSHTHGRSVCKSHDCVVDVGRPNSLSDSLLPALSESLCVISARSADNKPRWFMRTSGENLSWLLGRTDWWVPLQHSRWLQPLCSFQLTLINLFNLCTCISICITAAPFKQRRLEGGSALNLRDHVWV